MRFKERFPDNFDFKKLTEIRFSTGFVRKIINSDETDELILPNNKFPIYFYFPQQFNLAKYKHILIMINGFDERTPGLCLYYDKINKNHSISKLLSQTVEEITTKGVGKDRANSTDIAATSVLMPIPFHHWRRPWTGVYENRNSAQMIKLDKIRFFLGFHQLLCDIEGLIRMILKQEEPYNKYFDKQTKIHILGYSLGGMAALSLFLKDKINKNNKIETCHLLASGVKLQDMNLKARLTDGQREAIQEYYFDNPRGWRKHISEWIPKPKRNDIMNRDLFERVILGYDASYNSEYHEIEEQWVKQKHFIQYITCEKDEVLDASDLVSTLPKGAFNLHHTVKGVGHTLHNDREWLREEAQNTINSIVNIMLRPKSKAEIPSAC